MGLSQHVFDNTREYLSCASVERTASMLFKSLNTFLLLKKMHCRGQRTRRFPAMLVKASRSPALHNISSNVYAVLPVLPFELDPVGRIT